MQNGINFFSILAYSSSAFAFFPFVQGVLNRNKLLLELKLIWLLITLSIITDFLGGLLSYNLNISNLFLLNIYIVIESILLLVVYFLIIKNYKWKLIISILIALFIIYALFFSNFKSIKSLDNIVLTSESLSIMALSIIYFHCLLKFPVHKNLLYIPFFWINTALIFYFVGNLFLHLFSTYLQEHALYTFFELWGIWHSLLNILFYSLISIGFWQIKRT
jgi:hypothetical protein